MRLKIVEIPSLEILRGAMVNRSPIQLFFEHNKQRYSSKFFITKISQCECSNEINAEKLWQFVAFNFFFDDMNFVNLLFCFDYSEGLALFQVKQPAGVLTDYYKHSRLVY